MPAITRIRVALASRSHDILIGKRILPNIFKKHALLHEKGIRALLLYDHRLKSTANRLIHSLGKTCVGRVSLSGGDATKDIQTLPLLYKEAAKARLDRQSIILALGGGVIGDVAGFFAATYLRGIRILHIPTTLVAQVDSAIGGKTGINLPFGKNLVGAFHQPSLIAIDLDLLRTLPQREFISGLAEVIKYGVIADPILFRRLELRMKSILCRDPSELAWIIPRCCKIKAKVVIEDEYERKGVRAILNFGHTLGHGIELASRYKLLHGEAIALGMIAATRLSHQLQKLPTAHALRIEKLIKQTGLPTRLNRHISTPRILAAMRLDKKVSQGCIRFVLSSRLGSVSTDISVSEKEILSILTSLR